MAEADAVDEVREAPAEDEPEPDRQHRVARAGAGEEDEHPGDARPVSAITIVVAVGKKPNAIPEFWTWWIENGPSAAVSSPSCS